ncbi:MAG: hypothetical protein MRY21_02935 [Simkaniaceae bacterium]|nr:hypothetical protein [Simkaniaceae bacterium]
MEASAWTSEHRRALDCYFKSHGAPKRGTAYDTIKIDLFSRFPKLFENVTKKTLHREMSSALKRARRAKPSIALHRVPAAKLASKRVDTDPRLSAIDSGKWDAVIIPFLPETDIEAAPTFQQYLVELKVRKAKTFATLDAHLMNQHFTARFERLKQVAKDSAYPPLGLINAGCYDPVLTRLAKNLSLMIEDDRKNFFRTMGRLEKSPHFLTGEGFAVHLREVYNGRVESCHAHVLELYNVAELDLKNDGTFGLIKNICNYLLELFPPKFRGLNLLHLTTMLDVRLKKLVEEQTVSLVAQTLFTTGMINFE